MEIRKELQRLLRPGKMENPHAHSSYIVRFSFDKGEVEFVVCLQEQIKMAFDFLKERNPDFITVSELRKTVMSYSEY